MSENSELTSLEVLGIAIKSEIEATKLYEKMSGMVKNSDLKEKLLFLKAEEEKHRALFEDMHRSKYPDVAISLPKKSKVPLMDAALTDEMTIQDLFEVAMNAEKMAEDFYKDLAAKSKDVSGTSMLNYLGSIEHGHYMLLKNEYEMIVTFPAYVETEDFLQGEHFMHVGP